MVGCVLHVDADDLLAAPLENYLELFDVRRHGGDVGGVDHLQLRVPVRMHGVVGPAEPHCCKEEVEEEEGAASCVFVRTACSMERGI